jgi:galactokinase
VDTIQAITSKLNKDADRILSGLYGPDPAVLKQQTRAFIDLMAQFEHRFGNEKVALFSSPGRTEIGGNHTDHNHGRVLAGAVNLDNIAVAAKNDINKVRVASGGYRPFEIELSNMAPQLSEKNTSSALVRGILARMKDLGFAIGGFDVCIDGRVPKGSGLSSSASFEVLIGAIASHLYNDGKLDPVQNAIIGQYAENNYFGKPCGLMDQTACAVGGFITIDFKDPASPIVKKIDFDFMKTGYALVITDTGGSHAHLSDEYATLPTDMKAVADELGASVLRDVSLEQVVSAIPGIRSKIGDRAILRAYHFQGDNLRVARQYDALQKGDFQSFLGMVIESGYSSFMYNQNIYSSSNVREQSVAIGLALSEMVLKGQGAWRVHGGGFAGTIQAFVPNALLAEYIKTLEHVFGKDACLKLSIRDQGVCMLELNS